MGPKTEIVKLPIIHALIMHVFICVVALQQHHRRVVVLALSSPLSRDVVVALNMFAYSKHVGFNISGTPDPPPPPPPPPIPVLMKGHVGDLVQNCI